MQMKWDSALYDEKHDFVAEYGKGLLEFIPENRAQSILDLGCGTGALTAQLKSLADRVMGVDSSPEMIDRAAAQYPGIEFMVCDALALPFAAEWDVVFSNAVFHWIGDHDALLRSIRRALKAGGLLVCEFGAGGNIGAIEQAFAAACEALGHAYRPKFHFASAEEFGDRLERHGFQIDRIYAFDRPTVLKDGERGLANWVRQFFAAELSALPENEQADVVRRVEAIARGALWNGKAWVADYRRLRAIARVRG